MVRINGICNSSGSQTISVINGQVIINGNIVNNNSGNGLKEIDKTISQDCSTINKITIDSKFADVFVSASDSSKLVAHLYGKANVCSDFSFDLQVVADELRLLFPSESMCFIGELTLDIVLPKKLLNVLHISSTSNDITLFSGFSVDSLILETVSGDIDSRANFNQLNASTVTGEVYVYAKPTHHNVNATIATVIGKVLVDFSNFGQLNLFIHSVNGSIEKPTADFGFRYVFSNSVATVSISTVSGDITVF